MSSILIQRFSSDLLFPLEAMGMGLDYVPGPKLDWHLRLPEGVTAYGDRWAIQGNADPDWLLLPRAELEAKLVPYFEGMLALPAEARRGWVCGLGHGVTPKVPEENVHAFIRLQREMFA